MYKLTLRAILVSITVIGASCSAAYDSTLVDPSGQPSPLQGLPSDPSQPATAIPGQGSGLAPQAADPASPDAQAVPYEPAQSAEPGVPQLSNENESTQASNQPVESNQDTGQSQDANNQMTQGQDQASCLIGQWVGDASQVASQLNALVQQIQGVTVNLGASTMVFEFRSDGTATISAAAELTATAAGFGTFPGQAASTINGTWALNGSTLTLTTSTATLNVAAAGQQFAPQFGPPPGTSVSGSANCNGDQLSIQGGNNALFTPVNWTRNR